MNVYEKLTAARLFFQNAGVKMSGYNSFANYKYYELADILPVINKAAKEIGFCCVVRFGKEEATLEVIDCAKTEEKIIFSSPMSSANLKGCHEVQNLGAVESYVRRYLYLTAFEIVESDALDATAGAKGGKGAQNPPGKGAEPAPETGPKSIGGQIRAVLEQRYPEGGERVFAKEDSARFKKIWKESGPDAALSAAKDEASRRIQARRGGAA